MFAKYGCTCSSLIVLSMAVSADALKLVFSEWVNNRCTDKLKNEQEEKEMNWDMNDCYDNSIFTHVIICECRQSVSRPFQCTFTGSQDNHWQTQYP